ncbi:MAG TPA: hypothetical protein VLJ39_11820, partial [Tepidisphaeraceae bacterium]|nr:hypothetical protein [Tepidisphaeraceae bacterium]
MPASPAGWRGVLARLARLPPPIVPASSLSREVPLVSHIVTVKTEVRDPVAVAAACRRLGLP